MSFIRITRPIRITNFKKTQLEPTQENESEKLVEKIKKNLEAKEVRKTVRILYPLPKRPFPLKFLIGNREVSEHEFFHSTPNILR